MLTTSQHEHDSVWRDMLIFFRGIIKLSFMLTTFVSEYFDFAFQLFAEGL